MNYVLSLILFAGFNSLGGLRTNNSVLQLKKGNTLNVFKNVPTRLSATEIRLRMLGLPDWTTNGENLFYNREFENFVEAITFVNGLVVPAEQLGHHPDITIQYNRVSLELTTHDAGGLTELDFQLATKISELQSKN